MNKKGIIGLWIEVAIAIILFLLILLIPTLSAQAGFSPEPRAHAMIKTVGDTELCNINLLNLLRTPSSQIEGTVSDAIVMSHLGDDEISQNQIDIILRNIFEDRPYKFSVDIINENVYSIESGIIENNLSCVSYLPLPEPYTSTCNYVETVELQDGEKHTFQTLDGEFTVELINDICKDALSCNPWGLQLQEDIIEQRYGLYEQTTSQEIETMEADSFTLPLVVGPLNASYSLLVMESYADSEASAYSDASKAELILMKNDDIKYCSIKVTLTINQDL